MLIIYDQHGWHLSPSVITIATDCFSATSVANECECNMWRTFSSAVVSTLLLNSKISCYSGRVETSLCVWTNPTEIVVIGTGFILHGNSVRWKPPSARITRPGTPNKSVVIPQTQLPLAEQYVCGHSVIARHASAYIGIPSESDSLLHIAAK